MASAKRFEFSGYTFVFCGGIGSPLTGVSVSQQPQEVDNPQFQKGLKTALELYPYWARAAYLAEVATHRELTPEEYQQMLETVTRCPDRDLANSLMRELRGAEAYRKGREDSEDPARKAGPKSEGYVYLAIGDKGYHKIGKAKWPRTRLAALKKGGVVEYVCVIKTGDYSGLEKQLHDRFAHKRAFGEWFQLDDEDVTYIRSLAGEA